MASTSVLVAGLWFYLVISHQQLLFVALDVKIDSSLNLVPQPGNDKKENMSWDFFIFAFQWPQSFCNKILDGRYRYDCKVPAGVNQWTIHGLWPSTYSGEDVTYCCNPSCSFNETQIKDIEADLKHYWPDLLDPEEYRLWSHEWKKHGTCAGVLSKLAGEHSYFKKTMDIFRQFNFDRVFQTSNIEPSDVQTYQAENFTVAIIKALGYSPAIYCYTTEYQNVRTTYIVQIEICLDKAFQPMQCPVSASSKSLRKGYTRFRGNCGQRTLYYPSITHN